MLDLIEKKTPQGNLSFDFVHFLKKTLYNLVISIGVMLTMDEQLWVPKSSDETFIISCNKIHGSKQHPNYVEVKTSKVRPKFGSHCV